MCDVPSFIATTESDTFAAAAVIAKVTSTVAFFGPSIVYCNLIDYTSSLMPSSLSMPSSSPP